MDIRGPRLRKQSDEALAFTSSSTSDSRIARHVIRINLAHMLALITSREVSTGTGSACVGFLLKASPEPKPGRLSEDFHQQLEQQAVDELGTRTAGFLNYGKSRNDQVATAIRMELRERILDLAGALRSLQRSCLGVASKYGASLVPGYTHLQRAQPLTVAHHFLAHFDAFQRDVDRLLQLYERANLSPMGSAALAGTSARLDRSKVASSLGFSGVVRNSIDAVSSRDLSVEALSCATIALLDAARLAEEQILWSSKEFGFAELDDAYSASSSIMPQKKNPVVAEMVRAKSGSVLGSLVSVCAILKALPYSYNLDLQEATPHLWQGFDDAVGSVTALSGSVSTMVLSTRKMTKAVQEDDSTAVALANFLSKRGLSFREAHSVVGELVKISTTEGTSLAEATAAHLPKASKRFGRSLSVDLKTAKEILDPKSFLSEIKTAGGSNPARIREDLAERNRDLAASGAALLKLRSSLRASEKRLLGRASGLALEVKPEN
ncbi:MAG: argininosuccinate lyase [archaeon]|nr:MAG: argininosuccinate lyase [archaeon]